MPLFIDIHEIPGVTTEAAAAAHVRDITVQGTFDVDYSKYWINEQTGKVFCLCEAPTAEAAIAVHRAAHGLEADRIIEVTPELSDLFLGQGVANAHGAAVLADRPAEYDTGIRTVLFTDIVGSTTITQAIGDDAALELLKVHDRILRDAIAETSGREVKHTGDGIMAVFVSPLAAIRCAVTAQIALAAYAAEHPETPLTIRVGLATGEPVEHHNDFFGATVQLAARLCAKAEPAEILVSSVVADLCIGKGVAFDDRGEVELKGFADAVRVRSVKWGPAVA